MNNKLQSVIYLTIIFLFTNQVWAGELYICIDKNSNEIISGLPRDGMECQLKETIQKLTLEEKEREEYIELKKTITEREKAIADQKREKARTAGIRRPDVLCKHERSSCESDCNRNTVITYGDAGRYHDHESNSDRANCYMNCLKYQKTCIDKCYF